MHKRIRTYESILSDCSLSLYNLPPFIFDPILFTNKSCWQWTGKVWGERPIPTVYHKGKRVSVIKLIFKLLLFPYIPGIFKRKCGNNLCVNPWHLWSSSTSTTCFHGHIRTKENTEFKPTGARVCKICRNKREKKK